MRSQPREEDLNVSIVLRSGIATGDDKGKQPKDSAWIRKAPTKEAKFDLECARCYKKYCHHDYLQSVWVYHHPYCPPWQVTNLSSSCQALKMRESP